MHILCVSRRISVT
uniref:Uncharacterized protein n=1 Tax=Anguilla anguilla TaxID=7936 RepID=A0A0E9V1T3_ANGAN